MLVVKVAVVRHQANDDRPLFIRSDRRGVRVLELARHEDFIVRLTAAIELVELLLQTARVFGQRVRELVGDARQGLCGATPKIRPAQTRFADARAAGIGALDNRAERRQYRSVVRVFDLLVVVQAPHVVDLVVCVELRRNAVGRDAVDKRLTFRLRLQIGVTTVNFNSFFGGKRINHKQCRSANTRAPSLFNLTTLHSMLDCFCGHYSRKILVCSAVFSVVEFHILTLCCSRVGIAPNNACAFTGFACSFCPKD